MNQIPNPCNDIYVKIVENLRRAREQDQPTSANCSNIEFLCAICSKRVNSNQRFLTCTGCNHRVHIKCNDISPKEFTTLSAAPHVRNWVCLSCTIDNNSEIFPFTLEADEFLLALNNINLPSVTNLLPPLDITSQLTNLPNLSDYDLDENLDLNINSQYCAVEGLASLHASPKALSIFHMNIRSLSLHHDEFHTLLSNLNVDFQVIGLSEIKVSNNAPLTTNVNLPGYNFHYTASNSAAGGVGIYVKSNLKANVRNDLSFSNDDFETIWIEIENSKAKNVLCCCAYRHPSTDISAFSDHLQEKLSMIENENKLTFIMGDFNINLMNYDNHAQTNDFINLMFSHHLQPSVLHPTRITDTTSTLIDNIFVNTAVDSNIQSGNILSLISDHLPQFCIVNECTFDYKNSSYFAYDYSKFDANKFLADYAEIDTHFLTDQNIEMSGKFDKFLLDLNCIINKHCPQKKLSKRRLKLRAKPWINSRIQRMIRVRDRLFRDFKKSNSSTYLKAYKLFRNRVVNELKESKKNYYHQYFDENKSNMKLLWKGIKDIVNLKPSSADTISHLTDQTGSQIKDQSKIANEFNHFFTNVANDITKNLPRTPKSPLSYLSNPNLESFFISPCTSDEVSTVIQSLKNGKSCGPNSIPIKLMKILDSHVSVHLATLINESFETGIFPDKLKIAKVIPVFKKGLTTKKSNYRPISLLSIFSKIFEKIMYKRLYGFLEVHELLFNMQFGFRTGHSTDHALVSLTENIKSSLDNNRFGCGIFVDLQKAFDTVNHDILLHKLEHYGIRGIALNWFKSYLSNRKQFVSVNGHSSSTCEVACGVPQGSVLGPLLFLIYINDLPNSSNLLSFFLFADDTNIYFESDDLTRLTKTVNKELKKVKSWLDCNKLALNIEKTNFVIFHSPRKKLPALVDLKLGKHNITRKKYVKFLGVLVDEHLSWKYHISELRKKLSRTTGLFFKLRHYIPLSTLLCLYNSLFSSFLNYGIIVWGLTVDTYLDPLFVLQKKVLKCIKFQQTTAPSSPLFHSLKVLKLEDMIHLNILTFVFKAVNKLSPIYFHNYFTLTTTSHRYGTRQATRGDIFMSLRRTTLYGLKTVQYFGSKLWNTLPLFIRVARNVSNFRSKLKEYFINSYI